MKAELKKLAQEQRRHKIVERPKCPLCGLEAKATQTKFGTRNWCCGLWGWHGAPLVDKETHDARVAAHNAFDDLWQSGIISRSKAYKRLAQILGIRPEDCHMKLMSLYTARRVPGAVNRIKEAIAWARGQQSLRDRAANQLNRR